jgi:hypothetical protein
MIEHQLGQRNLNDEHKLYYIGKHNELQKKLVGRPNGNGATSAPFGKTAKAIAEKHKVSERTVYSATKFTRAIDAIADAAGNGARDAILKRDVKITRQEVQKLAVTRQRYFF